MRKLSIIITIILLVSLLPTNVTIAVTDYTPQADALNKLGLFMGTANGYELERAATRVESAVMTVRLFGKEDEAREQNLSHPFSDVPGWADYYVGYLYHNNITRGVSEELFGSAQLATPAQYATLVLRALGYDDAAGDFVWDKSIDKMVSLGILTNEQAAGFPSGSGVPRGDVVAISYNSLFAVLKGTDTTLLKKLFLEDEAISTDQLLAGSIIDTRLSMFSNEFGIAKPYPVGEALNSEEIFQKSSDAIFMIETKALTDSDFGSGSGFFITSDGIAVTNLHVISHMSSATIKTTDGSIYPVEGIIAINAKADLAIIKIKGSGFPYLELGNPYSLRIAQRIYCIGSPYGLDNTISDGLVSSLDRDYDGHGAIQISAPLAPGSSGGALLNEYGQVVGVTTATYGDEGTVNFAMRVTDLAYVFRFPSLRSVRYLQAHSHFNYIPVVDETYTRVDSDGEQMQIMQNDSIMYGKITSASDVHYYTLDAKETADMIATITSTEHHSAGLKFEISDKYGNSILKSRHYDGEIFSLATGYAHLAGYYTIKIYVEDNGEDWTDVDYELFWGYHTRDKDSDRLMFFFEFEPNDSLEHANYIPASSAHFAMLSSSSDVDYYTFTLAERSEFFSLITLTEEKSVLNAEVFNSEGRSMGKYNFVWPSDMPYGAEVFSARLAAGTYHIKVWSKNTGPEWEDKFYAISGVIQ